MDTSNIALKNVYKAFYNVNVLKDCNFNVKTGEVHILCGENGAGKSTLIKIIAGLYTPTRGVITIDGKEVHFKSPQDAENYGIAIVYQELSLCSTVSIAENMFIGREPGKFFINQREMKKNTKEYLEKVGLKLNPNTLVSNLSIAQMQLLQIAKALSQKAKFFVLDEPCSSLTDEESERLFEVIKDLKKEGKGIIYIDHRIENFFPIGDRVTILRDGNTIGMLNIEEADKETVINMMVGRKIDTLFPKKSVPASDEIKLEVKNLTNNHLNNISFQVRKGEIFGLGGMVGAGRSEVIRAIFGSDKLYSGKVLIDGEEYSNIKPVSSVKKQIGYVPEDRKLHALVGVRPPNFNVSLAFLKNFNKGPFLNKKNMDERCEEQLSNLNTIILNKNAKVSELSGGNQQKVILARWLINEKLDIILLDEPTRGVDVGVKVEIYKLIISLADQGVTIILVTSEMSELIGLCDRIAVLSEGELRGILDKEEFSQQNIMKLCI